MIADQQLDGAVTIYNQVDHREVVRFLSQADIGLCPFLDVPKFRMNIPTKIFEYMASGLPTVTFAYDALEELIGGDGGVTVAPRRIREMVDAVVRLLADREAAAALGRAAVRRVAERYTWRGHVEMLEGLFEDVLRRRSSARLL